MTLLPSLLHDEMMLNVLGFHWPTVRLAKSKLWFLGISQGLQYGMTTLCSQSSPASGGQFLLVSISNILVGVQALGRPLRSA